MIDDCPARVFAVVINTGNIDEIIEADAFGELADVKDGVGIGDFQGDFATELRWLGDDVTELGLDFVGGFEGGHRITFPADSKVWRPRCPAKWAACRFLPEFS